MFLIDLSSSAILPYRGIVAVADLRTSNSTFALITSIGSIGTAVISLLLATLLANCPTVASVS